MSRAGMSFRQILAALTTAPTERFGDGAKLGKIAPGFEADVVAFKEKFADVRYTIRSGKVW